MRKLLTLSIFLVLGLIVYYLIEVPYSNKQLVTINGHSLNVELANTDYLRNQGLMGRQSLPQHSGVLFLFPTSMPQAFWMKNTLIPLSIAYIKRDRTIADILEMKPDQYKGNLKKYRSSTKVKYALEVNQGWFKRHGIRVGDKVNFSRSIKRVKIE